MRPEPQKDVPATEAEDHGADSCNPHPSPDVSHFIIGYGSLMQTASKERTFKNTGENIPVTVTGFQREWNLKGDGLGPDTTYLGVVESKRARFNGVIFQLPPTEDIVESLKSYDAREHFYCRHLVPRKDIRVLGGNETGVDGQFWIYVNKPQFKDPPTKEYPIVQSYVDVFLSGCIELEEKYDLPNFAKRCVESTKNWSGAHWKNDRLFPRRPFVHQPKAGKIDKVLEESIPKEFELIQIE